MCVCVCVDPSQFLKFQAFAEQLTKETQDLKVKIESHKRENRRLANALDQHKEDTARITVRLAGTEKQRDDALEALVLQQEIAEELERERKRNRKELAALQHTNSSVQRQRDEAQRVVIHLRSLISGQAHHMEHLVRSVHQKPLRSDDELSPDDSEEPADGSRSDGGATTRTRRDSRRVSRIYRRTRVETEDGNVSPEMETRFYDSPSRASQRLSTSSSIVDVADRHLRDKTDAIANIIRNIAEQCAAAVEGLQLAHDADAEAEQYAQNMARYAQRASALSGISTDDGHDHGSEMGDEGLRPSSTIPPTPDLVHHRSSTSMSMASSVTTTTPERGSQQYSFGADIPMKIVEDGDEEAAERDVASDIVTKGSGYDSLVQRPSGVRISALGGQ